MDDFLDADVLDLYESTDLYELDLIAFDLIVRYMETEIQHLACPQFHDNLVEDVADEICDLLNLDYDDIYELVDDYAFSFFEYYVDPRAQPSNATCLDAAFVASQLVVLNNTYQPKQKTPEWYEYRANLITASNLWKVFNSEAQLNSLIFEKCKPVEVKTGFVNTDSPLHWGVKYEPVSIMLYEHKYNTTVAEFGCIKHPRHPCIGASPDGINVNPASPLYGRMIEVKNIVNREITGIPLEAYWVQMQIQMETCDLDDCDFIETRFKECEEREFFKSDKEKGIMSRSDGQPVYTYMPMTITNPIHMMDWINEHKGTIIYWVLDQFSCVFVKRQREWFKWAVPQIENTWRIVEAERVTGYEHRASKKRAPVCLIDFI